MKRGRRPVLDLDALRSTILELAIQAVDKNGDTAIKVNDLAAQANTNPPTLYRLFGSRDILLEQVHTHRFLSTFGKDNVALAQLIDNCDTSEEFQTKVASALHQFLDTSRADQRAKRLSALGATESRPALKKALATAQTENAAPIISALQRAQSRGLISPTRSIQTIVYYATSTIFGRTLIELDGTNIDQSEWDEVAVNAIMSLLQ